MGVFLSMLTNTNDFFGSIYFLNARKNFTGQLYWAFLSKKWIEWVILFLPLSLEYETESELNHHDCLLLILGLGWLDNSGDINQSKYKKTDCKKNDFFVKNTLESKFPNLCCFLVYFCGNLFRNTKSHQNIITYLFEFFPNKC